MKMPFKFQIVILWFSDSVFSVACHFFEYSFIYYKNLNKNKENRFIWDNTVLNRLQKNYRNFGINIGWRNKKNDRQKCWLQGQKTVD